MRISTRGRYALRVMIDLAERGGDGYIPMRDVAERQGISLKYLERILPDLARGGCIEGVHGKGGGYRLTRPAGEYTVGEILRLAEGDLAPVACLEKGAAPCSRAEVCRTLPLWRELERLVSSYLDSVTLASLVQKP